MSITDQLKPFLEPDSIAVVGAQPQSGEWAFNVVDNLTQYEYQGRVYPVNPRFAEVLGKKCYPSIMDIPEIVDLVLIFASRAATPHLVKQCADKGIKAAILVGQGFGDAGDEEGKKLQHKLVDSARQGKVRLLGPNSLGTANAFINFGTSFGKHTAMQKVPIALISQTGFLFGSFGRLSLVGKAIDLGNACDVDLPEALEYFGQDHQVKVIVLHIEGIRDGKRFREVAARVTREKPVLALKTARSPHGAKAAQSHTGSLVGNDDVWEAIFKQCGVIRINDLDELEDMVRTFCYLPLIKGRRIGVVTGSGGVGIMTADACARYSMEVAKLSPRTTEMLKSMAPSWLDVGNPVDFWPIFLTSHRPVGGALQVVLPEVLNDPNVDALVLFAGACFDMSTPPITQVIMEAVDAFPDKPFTWCPYEGWLYEISIDDVARKLEKAGKAAVFTSTDRAIKALSRLADYSEFLRATA